MADDSTDGLGRRTDEEARARLSIKSPWQSPRIRGTTHPLGKGSRQNRFFGLSTQNQSSRDETDPVRRPPTVSSMPRLRTDVFRRPIAAAYERIIQRLFSYRSVSGESAILVTSAVSGEGASTVARNTAMALAQHRNERVLLIDANLRTPSQHQAFGLDATDGLGDILLGTTTVASAVQEEVVPGLSLLTSGCAMESPAQLLTVSSLHSAILAVFVAV